MSATAAGQDVLTAIIESENRDHIGGRIGSIIRLKSAARRISGIDRHLRRRPILRREVDTMTLGRATRNMSATRIDNAL
jgi:hypothetical protein